MEGAFNDVNLRFVPGEFRDGSNFPNVGNPIPLVVKGDELVPPSATQLPPTANQRASLNNATMLLEHDDHGSLSYYRIRIVDVDQTPFWDHIMWELPPPVGPSDQTGRAAAM